MDDALQRVERFRRKNLGGPLVWSEEHWRKTCDAIQELADQVTDEPAGPTQSPVEDY